MHHRRLLFVTVTILLATILSCSTSAQKNDRYSAAIEEKIKLVENNLCSGIELVDSVNTYNLLERMKRFKVRGLSVAVVHNYKIEWARGYGMADTAAQTPVTTQTLFQAGSISKSLNAVGVLKLVQDKKLDPFTDINAYLQTWKFPYDTVSKGKKINTANLLSHTAGLTIHGFPGYQRDDTIPTLQQILDGQSPANTKAVRSQFEPGLRYQYSGGGTTISQLMVENITQQPYDSYMWENVLKPMDMTLSSYSQPPDKDKEKWLATGYTADGKEVTKKFHLYPEQAAAGLWTNPTDLGKYIIETQLSLQGKSNKVLSQEMTMFRLTPYVDSNAALGVFITRKEKDRYFGHNGSDQGFTSVYTGSFENGNGIIVMVNSNNGTILNEVVNSVAVVYGWKNYYTPIRKKLVAISDSLFGTYSGNYFVAADRDTLTIRKMDDGYFLTVNNRRDFKIYFTSQTEFFSRQLNFEFTFEKDAKGKVKGFHFKDGAEMVTAKKL